MNVIACIPAFNEEKIIGDVVKRAIRNVDRVIVCDDGSSDGTGARAEAAGAIVISHQKNMGKGAALHTLFDYALKNNVDIVVTLDGDGQFLPEEIPKMIKPIIEKDYDIVIGYRFDNNTEMPSYRKMGNKFLDKMTNLASNLPFRDTQSGFRAYSHKALRLINFSTNGFGADSEILIDASKKNLKIFEEKITVIYNTGLETSTKNPLSHTGEVIVSLIERISLHSPLRYLGIPGLVMIIIGAFFSVYVLSTFNETRYFSIPFTLVALSFLIIGLMLLLMSIVLFGIVRIGKQN